MKRPPTNYTASVERGESTAELLILPDGRVLAHNITPKMAVLLAALDPENTPMTARARSASPKQTEIAGGTR